MAKRIGVLDHHQNLSDSPRRFIKKSVALLLVRRLIAEEIAHNVIRMVAVKNADQFAKASAIQFPHRPRPSNSYEHRLEPRVIANDWYGELDRFHFSTV